MLFIPKELNRGHCRIWSSIHHDVIQYLERPIWLVSHTIFRLVSNYLFHKIPLFSFHLLRSHNRALESQPQAYGHAIPEGLSKGALIFLEVKFRQESQGS